VKTTIDIPEPLLTAARSLAAREGMTLKTLVEQGLRGVLEAHASRGEFRLRDAAFAGAGLQAGVEGTDWERLRDLAYEGRGA
jgi:hypothetical protein